MNSARCSALALSGLFVLASFVVPVRPAPAATCDPAAADFSGRQGRTFYVSKLGDNSDGGSWAKAFRTIQAALLAVPDDAGGHKIVVRPDTYVEANLYTNHKGAKGAYNLLIGDVDGRFGSGATGWVVIDSSCPGVAVGRFAGACVMGHVARKDEPARFCFKFARSKDLSRWEKLDGLAFAGASGKEYSVCPVVRYFAPYYYVIYLREASAGRHGCESVLVRSRDLKTWQPSPRNPALAPGEGEGCNASDVDLIEIDGKTFLYYAVGNQADWCELRRAVYPGPMREFFEGLFPEGRSIATISAAR